MRPQIFIRKLHKWVGLILCAQILLWFFSGFMMSFMDIDEVRGDHLLKPQTTTPIDLSQIDMNKITSQLIEHLPSTEARSINSLTVKTWLDKTVVAVKTDQRTELFSVPDMQPVTPFNSSDIERIVHARLKQPHHIYNIELLVQLPNEVRGRPAPLWQVQLADDENTRIYISPQSGDILAKRTDRWRLFDFMWMLHIMDYDERSDFNHPLLYITAFSALLFTLSGIILLVFGFKNQPNRHKKH